LPKRKRAEACSKANPYSKNQDEDKEEMDKKYNWHQQQCILSGEVHLRHRLEKPASS